MAISLEHDSLRTTLIGVRDEDVAHFRGIPYAKIPQRFALAQPVADLGKEFKCTEYGPRCPQVKVDGRHLLRIPPVANFPLEYEDEFSCTNLDVCVPTNFLNTSNLSAIPVVVWIHGGSQAVTFGSAKSRICDPTVLVRESIRLGMPMIMVNIQYRLNVFAIGDGSGPANLALQDQRMALDWVQSHIAGFGGDPASVTVYGESAGAVYAHAQLVTKAPAKQYILSSGTLHLSPPQPPNNVSRLRNAVIQQLEDLGYSADLKNVSSDQIIEAITAAGINTWFLQTEPNLDGWEQSTGDATRVLTTDVQYESIIWQRGIWSTDPSDIGRAFALAGDLGDELKKLYHVYEDRPTSCRTGALDFITDYKFVMPLELLSDVWQREGKPMFRAVVDEPNPWQPSTGAHHAVDVALLFGGFDLSFAPAAKATAEAMRSAWIQFVSNGNPWDYGNMVHSHFAFGPHGICGLLDETQSRSRRRLSNVEALRKMDKFALDQVSFALMAGKVSLLN